MKSPSGALSYSTTDAVSVAEFRELLYRSGLAARRPVEDEACLEGMLRHANLIVTCRGGSLLVGIARSVTDFHYCCYLSDLAVDAAYQCQGVGRTLIQLTQERLGLRAQIILLSAPSAVEYYPRLGFERHAQAWTLPRERRVGWVR
jgi:ribosomal protein S18 acetylase RimI-like enzyme